jgi:hypothetical protein
VVGIEATDSIPKVWVRVERGGLALRPFDLNSMLLKPLDSAKVASMGIEHNSYIELEVEEIILGTCSPYLVKLKQ